MTTELQASVAVATPVTSGRIDPPQGTRALGGPVMTGGVLSTNVMSWLAAATLPQASVAVQMRSIPVPAQECMQLTSVWLITTGPHASDAVAWPVTEGSVAPLHPTCAFGGTTIVGGVESVTATVVSHTKTDALTVSSAWRVNDPQ